MNIFDCKPIIFNAEMLQAAREGRKTVTRRTIKPQPEEVHKGREGWLGWYDGQWRRMIQPYMTGDILYAPEPWRCVEWYETTTRLKTGYKVEFKDGERRKFYFYDRERAAKFVKYGDKPKDEWQSPYFMPREAARLFFRAKDIRIERLQDIETAKIEAEGLGREPLDEVGEEFYRGMFSDLWDSTMKPVERDLYGWLANPWVWVIEFEGVRSLEEAGEPAGQYAAEGALRSAT